MSGVEAPDSHLLTACRVTPSSIASCSCVILRASRKYKRLSRKLIVSRSLSIIPWYPLARRPDPLVNPSFRK